MHDKKAEWIWDILDELEDAGLVTLADKGYQGSTWAKIPYRKLRCCPWHAGQLAKAIHALEIHTA